MYRDSCGYGRRGERVEQQTGKGRADRAVDSRVRSVGTEMSWVDDQSLHTLQGNVQRAEIVARGAGMLVGSPYQDQRD